MHRKLLLLTAAAAVTSLLTGCNSGPRLTDPTRLVSPYNSDAPLVFAVAPTTNESGAGFADAAGFSDDLVNQLQSVHGISSLPLNRTLEAMALLGMDGVNSPADAERLARQLEADAIIVSSLTAWDPYDPPELGITAVLYAGSDDITAQADASIDPLLIQAAWSDQSMAFAPSGLEPVSATALYLNAANHDVQAAAQSYAEGRHDPTTSLSWRRYVKSMTDYQQFAAYTVVQALLISEQRRLSQQRRLTEAAGQ